MNLKEMIADYLTAHGYDGLCQPEECCCPLDKLMDCGKPHLHYCMAGHKHESPSGGFAYLLPDEGKMVNILGMLESCRARAGQVGP